MFRGRLSQSGLASFKCLAALWRIDRRKDAGDEYPEREIELWDLQSGSQIVGSPIPFPETACLKVFSLRGDVLAAGNYDGEIMLWDIRRRA